MSQPPNFSEGGNVEPQTVALVSEILRLNTTEGLAPGLKIFAPHAKGHTVCFEVLAVDHQAREVKVIEFPTFAIGRPARPQYPEF